MEGLGYLASILVALSLTMSNVWRLRWINLAGAAAFVAYAGTIAAWPVFLVNAWIVGVDVFYLRRMARNRDSLEAFTRPADDPIIAAFIEQYRGDISAFFPEFRSVEPRTSGPRTSEAAGRNEREWLLVTRNLSPVGLVIYEWSDEKTVSIHADYVTPAYRDFKNGGYLYAERSGFFAANGATRVIAHAHVDEHRRYLKKVGFTCKDAVAGRYEKQVA